MARMTSPTGVTVNVSDEKAAQLASVGYAVEAAQSDEKKAPAKKAASAKKSE